MELLNRGVEVFGSKDIYLKWLHQKNKAYGNKAPSEFTDKEINDMLYRIEHGVYV